MDSIEHRDIGGETLEQPSEMTDKSTSAGVGDALAAVCMALGIWFCLYSLWGLSLASETGPHLLQGGYWPTMILMALGALAGVAAIGQWLRRLQGSGAADSAFIFRLAVCVGVITVAGYLYLFPTYQFLSSVVALGVAGLVLNALVLGLAGRPRGSVGHGFDMLVFNLCFLLAISEVLLSIYGYLSPNVLFKRADASTLSKVEQARPAAGSIWMGSRANAGGHNDRPFLPRNRRQGLTVLNIGDSFSRGNVPQYYHYTTVAERLLGQVEIYNMGFAAIGPREYLHLLLNEGLPLEPDLIVVAFFIGNDFGPIQPQAADLRPARRVFDRRHLLTYLVPSRLNLAFSDARARQGEASRPALAAQVAQEELTDLTEIHRAFPWLDDPTIEPPTFSKKQLLRIERTAAERLSSLPERAFNVRLERSLLPMRQATDVKILTVLIPAQFQVEDDLWQEIRSRTRQPELRRDRAQRVIKKWLAANQFPILDLLPAFRAVSPLADGRRWLYSAVDVHSNRRGNEVQGRELAQYLARHLPLDAQQSTAEPASP